MIGARKEGQGEFVVFVITIKCADSNGRRHDYRRKRVNHRWLLYSYSIPGQNYRFV